MENFYAYLKTTSLIAIIGILWSIILERLALCILFL